MRARSVRCPNCKEFQSNVEPGPFECARCGCRIIVTSEGKIKQLDVARWFVFFEIIIYLLELGIFFEMIFIEKWSYDAIYLFPAIFAVYFCGTVIHGFQKGTVISSTSRSIHYCYEHKNHRKFLYDMVLSAVIGIISLIIAIKVAIDF